MCIFFRFAHKTPKTYFPQANIIPNFSTMSQSIPSPRKVFLKNLLQKKIIIWFKEVCIPKNLNLQEVVMSTPIGEIPGQKIVTAARDNFLHNVKAHLGDRDVNILLGKANAHLHMRASDKLAIANNLFVEANTHLEKETERFRSLSTIYRELTRITSTTPAPTEKTEAVAKKTGVSLNTIIVKNTIKNLLKLCAWGISLPFRGIAAIFKALSNALTHTKTPEELQKQFAAAKKKLNDEKKKNLTPEAKKAFDQIDAHISALESSNPILLKDLSHKGD
jgi:hypothetical protein